MPPPLEPAPILEILRTGWLMPEVLAEHGLTPEAFQAGLAAYLQSKVPPLDGRARAGVRGAARILRDRHGVPHISAENAHDLFFAYGYATAQDRLWQLDYLRRAAHGRLAEIMGPDALASDIEVRTIGIGRLAQELAERLPAPTAEVLTAFSAGINAVIDACRSNLPVEFDILGSTCEPWTPADTLALMKHFWWQLTGRLYQITGPHLLRQELGDRTLFDAHLRSEVHGESILPPGENRAHRPPAAGSGSHSLGDDAPPGSNNWVLGPGKSASGGTLFASDPHTPYLAPTVWYEAHLHGAGYDVAGMGYVGVPGVIFGRNRKGAWGITNNICSMRDLFVYAPGAPEAQREPWTERIAIRGSAAHELPLSRSDLGPIVNGLLPLPLREGPPVALRWVGAETSDEIGSLLLLNQAGSTDQLRASLAGWACPTFNFVWADAAGDIAYQCAGRLPLRRTHDRGLRRADDPQQRWAGFVPYECNPWCVNPKQGWLATANNPVLPAAEDWGMGGRSMSDVRARRIRRMLESRPKFTLPQCAALQLDTSSERARDVLPALVEALESAIDERLLTTAQLLRGWDGDMRADSAAAVVFDAFAQTWGDLVLRERQVSEGVRELITRHIFGLGFELLKADPVGWFTQGNRVECIQTTMRQALGALTARLGDMEHWRWGDLHTLTLHHALGRRGSLGTVFDTGPRPLGGSGHTVNNQWTNPAGSFESAAGANCRVAADLSTAELHVTNCLGQSGHPGSPHYRDQLDDWLAGRLHVLSLDWATVEAEARHRLELER